MSAADTEIVQPKISPPSVNIPIVEKNGTPVITFIRYLMDITSGTGNIFDNSKVLLDLIRVNEESIDRNSTNIYTNSKNIANNAEDINTNEEAISANKENIATNTEEIPKRMYWRGKWVEGDYLLNDVVTDGRFTMIANKGTNDRAAPQPIGQPVFLYDGTLSDVSDTVKQIIFGTRYIFPYTLLFNKWRIYTKIGFTYDVFTVIDPGGANIVDQVYNFTATTDGWQEVSSSTVVVPSGSTVDIIAVTSETASTPTTWEGDWDYSTPNNVILPTAGEITHSNKDLDHLNIHKTDDNGGDRGTELEALTIGDVIVTGNMRWTIQQIDDNGNYMTFQVSPATQISDGVKTFTFETVTATPIETGVEIDANLGETQMRGLFIADGSYESITADDNQYGIDIMLQEIVASEDWEVVSIVG